MKTFDQLDPKQQTDAVELAFYDLVNLIRDGVVEVTLVNPASQRRLELILSKGRKEEKPRMITLRLLHDKPIRQEIERMALVAAHGGDYHENGDAIKELDHETFKRIVG